MKQTHNSYFKYILGSALIVSQLSLFGCAESTDTGDAANSGDLLLSIVTDEVTEIDTTADTVAPQAPGNLKQITAGSTSTSLQLQWDASTDNVAVSSYRIMRGTTEVGDTANTSFTDITVNPATIYRYTIIATDAAGNVSAPSNALFVMTQQPVDTADTTAPQAPKNLRLISSSITSASLQLQWDAATDNVGISSYKVMRGTSQVAITSNTSYIDNTVDPSTTYTYSIIAVDAAGNLSTSSNIVEATTQEEADTTAPQAPENLRLISSSTTSTSLKLQWDAAIDNVGISSYKIMRGTSQIAVTSNTSYTDNTVDPATTYSYSIIAVDAAGNISVASNVISATTEQVADTTAPLAPGNLSLISASSTSTSLKLQWDASTDDVALSNYIVMRGTSELGTTTNTSYTDNTVDPATTYSYSIIAVDEAGNSSTPSNTLSVTTQASTVVTSVTAKVYYVATNGSDSNAGTSISAPFATLSKAHSVVEAGDIIEMRAGTYAGATLSRPGTPAAWITLRAYQNETVIIDGDLNGGRDETLYFYHSSCEPQYFVPPNNETGSCQKMYWVVEGLNIKGGDVYSVQIDTPFVKLINNKIYDAYADNVKLVKSANDVVIFGNEIYKSGSWTGTSNAQGVDIVGADRTWVANNYVHDISSIGMYAKGNARDTIFENNLVENIEDSGIQLGQETDLDKLPDGDYESYNGIIRNNVIVRTLGPCLQTSSSKNVKIYNNSCYDVAINSQGAIRLADESLTSTLAEDIEIKNNIIVVSTNSSRPVVKVSADALADFSTLDIDNNLYWNTDGSGSVSFDWKGSTKTSLSSWSAASTQDSASSVGDPLYTDGANMDLTLASGASAAIDAGLSSSVVALDYNGSDRPSTGVDIGAYEYGATLPGYGVRDMPTSAGASTLFRYPFLQTAHATSMKIMWGVTTPGNALVYVREAGTSNIQQVLAIKAELIDEAGSSSSQNIQFYQLSIQLDGLQANTEYTYDIIHNGIALARGMDFKTMPGSNSDTVNAVVFGDSGVEYSVVRSLRNEIASKSGGSFKYPHDFMIGVGDIAYNSGTYYEFDQNFFGQLSGKKDAQSTNGILSDRPFFTALGNHEYANNTQTLPSGYLSSFDLPVNAGIPDEDKERYYSFDAGNAHFVILDSMKFVPNTSAAADARLPEMLSWLSNDLAASTKTWKLVFFHHAIFSNGGHGTYGDIGENRTLRQRLAPILQQYGVQMVMFGHDHMYERSVPLKVISDESDPDFGRIVRKANGEIDQTDGIVYVLTGHGGADFHNAATPYAAYGTSTWNSQVSDYGIGYDFAANNGSENVIFDVNHVALKAGFSHLEISPTSLNLNVYTHEGYKLDTYTINQ